MIAGHSHQQDKPVAIPETLLPQPSGDFKFGAWISTAADATDACADLNGQTHEAWQARQRARDMNEQSEQGLVALEALGARLRRHPAREHKAVEDQSFDLRGGVTSETAWELCCRNLSHPTDVRALGSTEVAQLLVYWLATELPAPMHTLLYAGMLADLEIR